jgi:hypothetical protein
VSIYCITYALGDITKQRVRLECRSYGGEALHSPTATALLAVLRHVMVSFLFWISGCPAGLCALKPYGAFPRDHARLDTKAELAALYANNVPPPSAKRTTPKNLRRHAMFLRSPMRKPAAVPSQESNPRVIAVERPHPCPPRRRGGRMSSDRHSAIRHDYLPGDKARRR